MRLKVQLEVANLERLTEGVTFSQEVEDPRVLAGLYEAVLEVDMNKIG